MNLSFIPLTPHFTNFIVKKSRLQITSIRSNWSFDY